jgi:hypothetical protein
MNALTLVTKNDTIKNFYVNQKFNESKHNFVFTEEVHPDCSDKYVPIQTGKILAEVYKQMGTFEWEVLRQGLSRNGLTHTKAHIVAVYFEPKNLELKSYGKFALYIINSSDRTKRLTISYGWLNGACFNGCVFGELVLETLKQRHMGEKARNIDYTVHEIVAKIKTIIDSGMAEELSLIKTMMKTKISMEEFEAFARAAIDLRIQKYSNLKNLNKDAGESYSIDDKLITNVMHSPRSEFKELTLWNAYQTIHENLGGNFDNVASRESKVIVTEKLSLVVNRVKNEKMTERNATLRKFNDIDSKVGFNQDLIMLMTQSDNQPVLVAA